MNIFENLQLIRMAPKGASQISGELWKIFIATPAKMHWNGKALLLQIFCSKAGNKPQCIYEITSLVKCKCQMVKFITIVVKCTVILWQREDCKNFILWYNYILNYKKIYENFDTKSLNCETSLCDEMTVHWHQRISFLYMYKQDQEIVAKRLMSHLF